MLRILVVDDDHERHDAFREFLKGHDVVHTADVATAIHSLSTLPPFDVAFLYHDLNDFAYDNYGNGTEYTGKDVARFIIDGLAIEKRPKQIVVHSWNHGGAKEMLHTLRQGGHRRLVRWEFDPKFVGMSLPTP